MRISDITNTSKLKDLKKKKSSTSSDSDFSGMLEVEEAVQVPNSDASLTIGSVISPDIISILNGSDDGKFNDEVNIEWGRDILKDLEMLRNQILMGQVTEMALHRVEEKLNKFPLESQDKALKDIVEEIRTRAVVELAKIERFKVKD